MKIDYERLSREAEQKRRPIFLWSQSYSLYIHPNAIVAKSNYRSMDAEFGHRIAQAASMTDYAVAQHNGMVCVLDTGKVLRREHD